MPLNTSNMKSELVGLSRGNVEYSISGEGPVLLIAHGTLGGYDQGMAVGRVLSGGHFRLLAVSRAGYLRSSVNSGRNPAEQAQTYKELIDHLGILRVAVLGVSGGAPSAIAFSEQFPDSTMALILVSSISTLPTELPPFFRLIIRIQAVAMRVEQPWRLLHKYALPTLMRSNGVSRQQCDEIMSDPQRLKAVREIFSPITTSGQRRQGLKLDDAQINALPAERVLRQNVPALVAHAINDPLASPTAARQLALANHNVKYLEFPDGGHLFFVVHHKELVPAIMDFVQDQAR